MPSTLYQCCLKLNSSQIHPSYPGHIVVVVSSPYQHFFQSNDDSIIKNLGLWLVTLFSSKIVFFDHSFVLLTFWARPVVIVYPATTPICDGMKRESTNLPLTHLYFWTRIPRQRPTNASIYSAAYLSPVILVLSFSLLLFNLLHINVQLGIYQTKQNNRNSSIGLMKVPWLDRRHPRPSWWRSW